MIRHDMEHDADSELASFSERTPSVRTRKPLQSHMQDSILQRLKVLTLEERGYYIRPWQGPRNAVYQAQESASMDRSRVLVRTPSLQTFKNSCGAWLAQFVSALSTLPDMRLFPCSPYAAKENPRRPLNRRRRRWGC